ncbi:MAG: hypothetical protein ABIF11_09455 [Nitrospirota bacterium]
MELKNFYSIPSMVNSLFNTQIELLSSVTEFFELELAYLEYHCLNKDELLSRSAYLKSIDEKSTQHFLMCNHHSKALTEDRSATTKNYFENGQFSTGYATHGLFPYRGKFHPQLIKALLNIIGLKKGEIVLDPMCGSGTANIEASLMGINSYALDLSPFCQFMTKVKYESLTIKRDILNGISAKAEQLFDFFNVADVKDSLKKINGEL